MLDAIRNEVVKSLKWKQNVKRDERVGRIVAAVNVVRRGMNECDNDLKVDVKDFEGEYVLEVDVGGEVKVDEEGEWEEKEREGDEVEGIGVEDTEGVEMVVAHDGDGGRLCLSYGLFYVGIMGAQVSSNRVGRG
nr:hypothetical protein [Tanacetum cinerariifolium]